VAEQATFRAAARPNAIDKPLIAWHLIATHRRRTSRRTAHKFV
jgi:hypothetical protein